LVVGTKIDLNREVEITRALTYCESHDIPYIEVSSQQNVNITEAFILMVTSICKDKLIEFPSLPKILPNKEFTRAYCNRPAPPKPPNCIM